MRVAIVGAGFSGVGMGVALQRAGHEYAIFERAGDLGGVWQHNTYPGACCDVPSYVYSYSWAQRRDWSRPCSPQDEIQDYLREVATEQRVIGKIRFGSEVTEARWDPARLKWRLTLRGSDSSGMDAYEADAVVLGCGQLSRPSWPQDPGRDRVRRPLVPLGGVGSRARSDRRARSGDRHRRLGDPVHPGDRATASLTWTSTSAARPTCCRAGTSSIASPSVNCSDGSPAPSGCAGTGCAA